MLMLLPKCPTGCGGYVRFRARIIYSPFVDTPHLGTNDLVCDTCHKVFQTNIFNMEFDFTMKQIKSLIRDFGECTIDEFLNAYPCDIDKVCKAFSQLSIRDDK